LLSKISSSSPIAKASSLAYATNLSSQSLAVWLMMMIFKIVGGNDGLVVLLAADGWWSPSVKKKQETSDNEPGDQPATLDALQAFTKRKDKVAVKS
jgi:hypothetical protein